MASFAEVIRSGMTPADRLYLAIDSLQMLAQFEAGSPVGIDHTIGVAYGDKRGMVQSTFTYFQEEESLFLPCFERYIQSGDHDMRERHVLNNDSTTTSLLRNGMSLQGGDQEKLTMARGVEGIMSKILDKTMDRSPDISWWIRERTRVE
ncbi:MAG: hypothetical protein JWP13_411 [Candidatus Saccharibacteria bacterium]|nr:hypothetical protein [Candidatus Saccharibacteria bacterium]